MNTTTVYRYLDKLCAEHTVIKYPDLNSDKAVFQFAGEEKKCAEHLHLKCIRCGKVVHLDCDFMDELKEHLYRDHGFRLQCSGDMLHEICLIIHLIDTGTVIRQATAPDSMTATSWNRNWELRMISRVYCCV